jgi:sulfur-oxidizing protein SoxY
MLKQSLALGGLLLARPGLGVAGTSAAGRAIAAVVAGRSVTEGGIELDLPAIAENGNTVPIRIEVPSPFTPDDFVRAVHVFAPANPAPEVLSCFFTTASGKARVASRIRLAETQQVVVIAELSDGRVLRTARDVKVTVGGCGA